MHLLLWLDRRLLALYRLCGGLAAVALAMIAVLVGISIGSRLLGLYVPGLTEGAGYGMAAAGSLGLAYTLGQGSHIRVAMLLDRLAPRPRRALELCALAVSTGLAGWMAFYLLRMTWMSYLFQDRSSGSDGLLLWIPQLPAALGFAVFAVALLHMTIVAAAGPRR